MQFVADHGEHIHAGQLFDVLPCARVEPQRDRVAVLHRARGGKQRRRIIGTGFRSSHSTGCRPHLLSLDEDLHGAGGIGFGRICDDHEPCGARGADGVARFGTEHERANIQRLAALVGHERRARTDHRLNSFEEQWFAHRGHRDSFGGTAKARVIVACAEQIGGQASDPVRFHAFERLFSEMQCTRAGQDLDRPVGQQFPLVPFPVLEGCAVHHGRRHETEPKGLRQPEIRNGFPDVIANDEISHRFG